MSAPQLPEKNTSAAAMPAPAITAAELQRCREILDAIVVNRGALSALSEEDRRALLIAAGRVSRPAAKEERMLRKAFRRKDKGDRRSRDKRALASTEIRTARQAPVFAAPLKALPHEPRRFEEVELERPRNCYVCKAEYSRLHFFYDSMCRECAEFNYAKRYQLADCTGRVALLTGARVKIGYHAALMLLRAGASVLICTRFPNDAAQRYARESDFAEWQERVHVFGLDLRHSPSVEILCRYLTHSLGRLDIIINNAAQTVRRPAGYYQHLLPLEQAPHAELPAAMQPLLRKYEELKALLAAGTGEGRRQKAEGGKQSEGGRQLAEGGTLDAGRALLASTDGLLPSGAAGIGIRAPAQLSQARYTYEDAECGRDVFPPEAYDADLQQVDLRPMNSWRMTLADVPTPELLEVQLVNSIAPFILCSKLKALLLRSPAAEKHVINVTAMEGIFSRGTKTDKHPHTNMAKAALNMLTFTSARDYADDGIYMNAVDTGWVTDEDPLHISLRKQEEHDFQPPLDIVDGAARLVDPIFSSINGGEHVWGKFLKDYKPANW